ncbi:MAG: DNA methyltransferase [Bacteroidales bacterium]|jgi:DNA modification methylase
MQKLKMNMLPYNKELNELGGSDWTKFSKSVQNFNGCITEKRKIHGAAFPLSLAKHFISIYSKTNDIIFDPFAGVGTTLDAANLMKRNAIGTELNKDFIMLFNQGIDKKDGIEDINFYRKIINDSATNLENHIQSESIDMILTSPPYANLLNNIRDNFADKDFKGNTYKNQSRKLAKPYSENEFDLGNVVYEEYLIQIKNIFLSLNNISREGTYNVWVVRDYRDLKNNIPYVNLHCDLINIASKTGWIMWDMVIWDQSNQRKLVKLGGNKSRRFYFNIGYSIILVFRKNIKGEKF